MGNFLRTISSFSSNHFVSKRVAVWRHTLWQGRKILNLFPYDIPMGKFDVRVADRAVANGIGAMVNALGYFDPNNMYFLEEIFQRKICKNFYDVGANIGVYSLLVASSALEAGVCAFEPHPKTFSLLRENVFLNGFDNSIQCFQSALGETNGKVNFTDNPGSPVNIVLPDDRVDQTVKTIQVDIRRGDSFAQETGVFPEAIKIDVEGFENDVLRGFSACLPTVKMVLVECQNVVQTTELLCSKFGFAGPFKIDYKSRCLVNLPAFSYEDWLYLSPPFLAKLSDCGFNCSHF
jgi:FkbM family methyltransferase